MILLLVHLRFTPAETPPEVQKGEILNADEYIAMEDIIVPEPEPSPEGEGSVGEPTQGPEAAPADASGHDVVDAGEPAPVAPIVTTPKPSPVKEQPKPQQPASGTVVPNEKKEEAPKAKVNVKSPSGNSWNTNNTNSNGNNPNAPNDPNGGNTDKNVNGSQSGLSWMSGYSGWVVKSKPTLSAKGIEPGTVTIKFEVNAEGKVTSASLISATGGASGHQPTINQCLTWIRNYQFKKSKETDTPPDRTVGHIVFRI